MIPEPREFRRVLLIVLGPPAVALLTWGVLFLYPLVAGIMSVIDGLVHIAR